MDNAGQHENGRYMMDNYNGMHGGWNMTQFQTKESNDSLMNKKMMKIMAEKEVAINELNRAISEKNYAFQQRNEAMKQRDEAITARDTARREKESAIAALRFQESSSIVEEPVPIKAVPIASETPQSRHKEQTKKLRNAVGSSNKKGKKVGEDLNRSVTTDGSKAEWESQDLSLVSQISYDKSTMATPVCSCTGQPRQCYKWGDGGWQSSCCTTNLSMYPLPHMENKRHSRIGGRKMSGSVFARLISRLAVDGHDLSMPIDLKDFWAKHGTNRYITIK
ncbi:protein BASIC PENTACYSTEINE4 isoform X2 [Impatiens glandulifera]|uniref:protein BASIC PENTACYSTEINE4 isoform X2 n=1 Tax=Impatiens glandulifera TaxID=253017 RepID=UPI001FB0A39F|nr:protein BASIC PENTACYSTEINE4 isoform X2 [Impatiens glandulifera]